MSMPHSRSMRTVGPACHELRILDGGQSWRIIYHLSSEAVVLLGVFAKKTDRTPKYLIQNCKRRLRDYLRGT